MPQFQGSITDKQANAIVAALYQWTDYSTAAAIICDAVSADITLQPLHDAYARHPQTLERRGIGTYK